ncbi:hypothetical protein [Oceanobacillus oncorhynchi]|uniref:hypothetical protein n=1 Tax=Oceanobacillus oncorhynchi TaxID=545501 RepID=UPI0031DE0191
MSKNRAGEKFLNCFLYEEKEAGLAVVYTECLLEYQSAYYEALQDIIIFIKNVIYKYENSIKIKREERRKELSLIRQPEEWDGVIGD